MNRDEIKKAVADAVVGFARSEAEAAIKSIDLDHQLVGEDSEQAVYYIAAASSQSYCG